MDRKFKLALIAKVERHPEIWDFSSDDYRRKDFRTTAWKLIVSELQAEGFDIDVQGAKTSWKRLKDTFSKRQKLYPPGSSKAWIYDDDLQFLMSNTNSGAENDFAGDEADCTTPYQDVKTEQLDKEGSVTTEDGFTDTSSASVASPSVVRGSRQNSIRRNSTINRDQTRSDYDSKRQGGTAENVPDRFDILGQYIAQTLRELSPEVSSAKILEITKVLHTNTPSIALHTKAHSTKASQQTKK